MYPFGKEESVSLERLFWFFCESVQRGDWELAQACVPQLHQWKEDDSEKVEAILHALVVCPFRLRCGPNHSPQKLAWFWLLVLKKWLAWEQKTVPVALQKETEFLLLLEELEKDAPHAVLKELYEAFQDRHTLNRKQRDGSVHKFSVEVMSVFRRMLLQTPRRLEAMLELLQRDPIEHGSSLPHSCFPQHIFIGFLWDSLKHLKRLRLNPDLSESDWSKTVDEIYNALSLLNLETESQTGELRLLCRELLDACWAERSPLREERLLGCLLRNDSHALLSLFSSVFIEKTREKLLRLKSPGQGTSEQMDAERAVMALFLDHEQAYSWKAAYFYCLSSNKHFLEQILVTALALLKREDFSSLSSLLKQEFSHLSRLLILLGWTQCRSLESAKMLLETLHKTQGLFNDSILKDFCDGLCAQVDVLEWCIQQNSNTIPEKLLLQHLHSLECHSSLYLLYHLTDLLALNEEAVIELLQKIPVRTIEVQDSAMMPASTRLGQQRNLILFQAFCAMKYAIYALCVNVHKGSHCKDCASQFVSDLPDELPDQNKPTDQPLYPDYVSLFAQYLAKCQHYLRTVPVPLRLELLENIFSLLFVSYSDLCSTDPQEEENTEDAGSEKSGRVARRLERCASQGSSTSASPQHSAGPRRRSKMRTAAAPQEHSDVQMSLGSGSDRNNCTSFRLNYLDLKHFTRGVRGFLVDEVAMEIFLQMLLDHLKEIEGSFPWDSRNASQEELALLDCLNLSISRDGFVCHVQLLSKYLSEAQWRYKIVLSNRNAGSPHAPNRMSSDLTGESNLKRQSQSQRQKPVCKKGISESLVESTSSELSITSTSEGSASSLSDWSEVEYRRKPQRNLLIPMMLSPPESLLVSCILRGNYIEAHQVAIMFHLETSASYGELIFLERYQEVISELAKVEHKIEHQSCEGSGHLKQPGSGHSTLKAIGNAAAAGMVFYSISDVTDKLLAPSEGLVVPMLQENFWASSIQLEPSDPLNNVLEGLCPAAMVIFDLASTQCHLWKTCKQLLETAERRLHNSLEMKGRRFDSVLQCPEGMRGFPAVLQQISKIVNISQGHPKSAEISSEKISSHFHCSIADLLQSCYPALTENCITNQIVLSQCFDQILQKLEHVEDASDSKGNLLASLVEQASLKPAEVEAHPVYKEIKLLLRTLDQHAETMQESSVPNAYVQRFFDYLNRLAAIVLRSLTPELDQSAEVRVGNPFILLQQTPSHLLSQLLFEKQVLPDRLSSLLAKEELKLNVQQVIIDCCCKALLLCNARQHSQTRSLLTNISSLAHLHAYHCLPDVEVPVHNLAMDSGDPPSHTVPPLPDQNQHMLTASTLNFLKSQSKLTAAMACLNATKVQKTPRQSLSWMEFRGKREAPLSIEQISKECEALLKGFPLLENFLLVMSEPLQDPQDEGNGLASGLCGKSYVSLLFLGLHSDTAVEVLTEVFEHALTAGDWSRALKVLDLYSQDTDELITVRDAVLSCATADEEEGWQYLFQVRDAMLRSRLALRCLDRWPLEACLEILAYCACDPEVSEELRSDLQSKTRELQVYQKILSLQEVPAWHDWQDLKRACTEDSQAIIEIILEAKDYELCEEWGNLYSVPREHLISLHQEHLLHLLEKGDMEKALQLLQRIDDPDIQLTISEQCLDKHPGLAASHFLADYLTTYFYKHLTIMRHNEIQALYIGSKVLLTLPEPYRASYSHLSCKPMLMLEQLLMNMKVDWAAVAIQTVHQLLVGQEIGFTVEDIDALLCKYAGKALEFPFSLKEKRSDSVIQIQESLYRGTEPDTLPKSESVEKFPASSTDTSQSPSPVEKSLQQTVSLQEFVPPEKPPPKQQWIPDETEATCMVCKTEHFTMFNRRHHCRRCGRLVCSSCSSKKMVVENCRENPARVCDQCYSYHHKEESPETPQDTEILKEGQQDQTEAEASEDGGLDFSAAVQVPKMTELEWLLSLREEENEIVYGEFYYEQAPSASLCIAIFNLHSDSTACGHQLIEHCCRLSQGLTNPEVDAGLLMDIMKQLLFSAKMMFVKTGRSQDLALCDSYISKVDVLNILVAAAYRRVPSLDQILQPAAVTRLRNQLLEAEYYQLAVEVSTKTGLDPGGAWHAWGMACLKASNLTAAREKFSRCLKPPFDLNQLSLGSRMVQDVVQYLESTVKPILSGLDDDYFATLRELEAMLRTRSLSLDMTPEGKIQNNTYYQECLFYLHNYSTNLAIISFYMRHDCMREALLHLLHKESPQEVFIEGIFVPSYKSGKLHLLENLLESIDPGLESWGSYLIAACKHLQKKNYYHILYELQQFMKDQVRAAMTCIRFFTHKAKSYTELGERQKWLLKVKDHLKVYLQEVSRSSGRKRVACTFRKKMQAPDVSRHINTVELQMEVTKFLYQCEKSGASSTDALSVPTLFGNNQMKMEVACKVMLEGKNIEEGFGIAFRVLQDFQLEAAAVYNKVARQLVKQQNYSEIRQLLKCIKESGAADKNDGDNVILSCLDEFDSIPAEELDNLIQDMDSDENKIQAYLRCHKLRSAYLVSVKQENTRAVQLVQHVRQLAENSGEDVVQAICTQWLAVHHTKPRSWLTQSSKK
ncbi:zinc finger FYVE domain-containing protein 26 isoform X1 [Varanus komodoensis]|uniref:zinc finger FYVE domain-containing protein 26 isoform X1 n=1 Tax=Varanus komodoensis TaxID=61221 RepID=UPI001CF7E7F1|nr:zinc finger FYVE domain-containing protein 26 isoform X1 [Varanus komodoensis]XP_044292042.1 zinc finger FYVE domain-containing protein 26 isoform X1 [Varanus komodoensis]